MCGIAGFLGEGGNVRTMTDSIAHRGPDWAGTWANENAQLGHRLLAIRDTSEHSKQPYTKPGSPWILLFNGQIYNTESLKKELGVSPSENLDTAVLYALIERDGWNFVSKAFGMFAIALYNTEKNELRLYRDPAGQKPLYYTTNTSTFYFGSEIKALRSMPDVIFETDREALLIARTIGYIPGNRTLIAGVQKVQPGEVITYDGKLKKTTSFFYSQTSSNYYLENSLRGAIQQTVLEHLQAKEAVALNLSGGLDSSVLLHEMNELGHPLMTYTTSFENAPEKFNSDANLAKKLAEAYKTKHVEISITKKIFLQNLHAAYVAIEEPNYNISNSTYLETAKREGINGDGHRVILSGDGGDELFGGYSTYPLSVSIDRRSRKFGGVGYNLYQYARTGIWWDYTDPLERWAQQKILDPTLKGARAILPELRSAARLELKSPEQSAMALDRMLWLAAENFTRSDKLFMQHSLELRSPFAYNPLRQFCDKLLTQSDYFNESENKHALRNAYRGVLPEYITEKSVKSGWRSPVGVWWDSEFVNTFREAFDNAPRGGSIDWIRLSDSLTTEWPGKRIFAYYSLALLSAEYGIVL